MLAVTYGDKTYNVLVEKMNNSAQPTSQGGTSRTQRNKRKQNRSKPTRRIKR
jgi:hypothetical protein